MEAGRADEFYSTKENWIINLEEESDDVSDVTLRKISNYAIFADFMYSGEVYCAILCHKDPSKYPEYYERSPSISLNCITTTSPKMNSGQNMKMLLTKLNKKKH